MQHRAADRLLTAQRKTQRVQRWADVYSFNLCARRLASSAAATAAAVSASSTTTTTTTTAATAIGFGPSFVDHHASAADFGLVQLFDGLLSLSRVGHLHKSESARTAGFAINNDVHLADLSERFERGPNILVGRCERKVAHVNVSHVKIPYA
jgi:hypothetical protein